MVKDKINKIKLGRSNLPGLFIYDMLTKLVTYKTKEFPEMYYCALDNIIMVEYNSKTNSLFLNYDDVWGAMDKFYEHYTYDGDKYMNWDGGLYGLDSDNYELVMVEENKRMEQEYKNDEDKLKVIEYIFRNYPNDNLGFSYEKLGYISKFYRDVDIRKGENKFRKLFKEPTLLDRIKKYFKNDKG